MTVSDALANLTDPASVGLLTVAGAFVLIAVLHLLWAEHQKFAAPSKPREVCGVINCGSTRRIVTVPCQEGRRRRMCARCAEEYAALARDAK